MANHGNEKVIEGINQFAREVATQIFNASNRTISRWENGKNMLGFDVLVEIRKILDGERKGKNMNKEMEDTVLKVADYTNTEAQNHNKRVHRLFLFAIVFYVLTLLFEEYVAYIGIDFLEGFSEGFLKGGMLGIILVVFFITGRYGKRMRDFKLHILHKIKK